MSSFPRILVFSHAKTIDRLNVEKLLKLLLNIIYNTTEIALALPGIICFVCGCFINCEFVLFFAQSFVIYSSFCNGFTGQAQLRSKWAVFEFDTSG